ncbi:MAG: hypothetical protein LBR15_05180 [Methanobrevibacter sp.]|nr:hypothetical protein [Candidatus Methanovirga australis]
MFLRKYKECFGLLIIILLLFTNFAMASNNITAMESNKITNTINNSKSLENVKDEYGESSAKTTEGMSTLEKINNDIDNSKYQLNKAKWYQFWKKIYYGIRIVIDNAKKIFTYIGMGGDIKKTSSKENNKILTSSLNSSKSNPSKTPVPLEYNSKVYTNILNVRDRLAAANRPGEIANVFYNDSMSNIGTNNIVQFIVPNTKYPISNPVYKYFSVRNISGNSFDIYTFNLTAVNDPNVDKEINNLELTPYEFITYPNLVLNESNCQYRLYGTNSSTYHGDLIRAYDTDPTGIQGRINKIPDPPDISDLIIGIPILVVGIIVILIGIFKILSVLFPSIEAGLITAVTKAEALASEAEPLIEGAPPTPTICCCHLCYTFIKIFLALPGLAGGIGCLTGGISALAAGLALILKYTKAKKNYNDAIDSIKYDIAKYNSALEVSQPELNERNTTKNVSLNCYNSTLNNTMNSS